MFLLLIFISISSNTITLPCPKCAQVIPTKISIKDEIIIKDTLFYNINTSDVGAVVVFREICLYINSCLFVNIRSNKVLSSSGTEASGSAFWFSGKNSSLKNNYFQNVTGPGNGGLFYICTGGGLNVDLCLLSIVKSSEFYTDFGSPCFRSLNFSDSYNDKTLFFVGNSPSSHFINDILINVVQYETNGLGVSASGEGSREITRVASYNCTMKSLFYIYYQTLSASSVHSIGTKARVVDSYEGGSLKLSNSLIGQLVVNEYCKTDSSVSTSECSIISVEFPVSIKFIDNETNKCMFFRCFVPSIFLQSIVSK